MNAQNRQRVVTDQSVDSLLNTIRIPPRPSLLIDVQNELSCDDPDPDRLSDLISNDVSLSAALLKLANSPFFGLRLKASSTHHAVRLLGMNQCVNLMTGILARQSVQVENLSMVHFWDASTKRAHAMASLASKTGLASPDISFTFGLFCHIGIPILIERFPEYPATLEAAERSQKVTDLEYEKHHTDHAMIGSLMARTWGLPEIVSSGILLHHEFEVLFDRNTEESTRSLIALSILAEYAIHRYQGKDFSSEWQAGGGLARDYLGLSTDDVDDRIEELVELFNHV